MVKAAVIVPALNRPNNVARFMESFYESEADARVYWVCDEEHKDQIEEVKKYDSKIILNHRSCTTFPCKVNVGYHNTEEEWMFLVGDDVIFHKGWLEEALLVAKDIYSLIATNDLGNRNVMEGRLATHPLIRRRWVDSHGASWDGPGVLAHEGYHHMCVDREWSTVAKQDDKFAFAPKSIVEHMHPNFNKGDFDDVYSIGHSKAVEDERLFELRKRKNT